MDKEQVIDAVSRIAGGNKTDTRCYLNAILGVISDALKRKDNVVFPDFGKLQIKRIPKKTVRNPKTGEQMIVPEHEKVSFTPYRNITSYSEKYKR